MKSYVLRLIQTEAYFISEGKKDSYTVNLWMGMKNAQFYMVISKQ